MSDFILDYDILESIAKNSNSLGKRSDEYAEQLERKIINAIGNVTGPSTGYLSSASDSVRDKMNALKLKSETFYHFSEQILNLLEVAEQIDQEVADAIAAGREYFLDHHESLRIDDWKAKLLGLYVDMKNSIPLLGEIADILGGLDAIFESLKDSLKHWYECEGGKYIFEVIKSVVEVGVAIGFLALAVAALSLPGAAVFAVCGIIGASIGIVNAVTNVATSYRAADAAMDGNPAWAMIYGKQDRLSDVLRQTNFGNGVFNDLSNLGAGAIDITETVCLIVGFAEAGAGVAKLFKGDAFKLLKNKGALNLSDLKSGVKNGILDLKSSIKQGYKDLKGGLKGLDNVASDAIKGDSKATKISTEMEKKILEGQRKSPIKNEVIGGHSPKINNTNDLFAVEELSVNADGTKNIKFIKDFQDGNISKIKKSTIFPDSWSDSKIMDSIKEAGDSPTISIRGRDGATWHRKIIDGVEIDVIKVGDDVISGYPTGKVNAPKPSGF